MDLVCFRDHQLGEPKEKQVRRLIIGLKEVQCAEHHVAQRNTSRTQALLEEGCVARVQSLTLLEEQDFSNVLSEI